MKKAFVILFLVITVLMCSCTKESGICYYGFLGNEAAAFIYSNTKNTVYLVKLPIELIIEWGESHQITSVDYATIKFCGLDADGMVACSTINWKAVGAILEIMNNGKNEGPDAILQTYVDNSVRISQEPLASAFSNLLGSDISEMTKIFAERKPDVYCLDATQYNEAEDIDKVQKFIQSWLGQVLSEDKK